MKDLIAYYGLKNYPFDKTIKTHKLVETAPLKECQARCEFMKQRGGLMLLTGDPGVGKTVALRRFVDGLNENLFVPVYTPLSTLKPTDLFRHINDKLGLPPRMCKSRLFEQIQHTLLTTKEVHGKMVVLIIDEAHLLQAGPLQELRLLTNFKMDAYDPFILILAGQTDLKRIMDFAILEPLKQRLALAYHMAPLNEKESQTYIEHHLALVGSKQKLFAQDAYGALYQLGFGLPRKMGKLALQALTYAMFEHKKSVNADMVLKIKHGI